MPVALISTRTSPAFGPSRSTSTISSGFLASNATAARVFIPGSTYTLRYLANALRHFANGSCASFPPHAGIFRLGVGIRLVFLLGGTNAPDRVIGAGAQIDVDVVHVTGDVRVIAERRHHVLLRRVDVLAAAGDNPDEIGVSHGLDRFRQGRRVGRSHSVRSVADMAFGMVAAEAGIGVPV